jgi:hypothetical protein
VPRLPIAIAIDKPLKSDVETDVMDALYQKSAVPNTSALAASAQPPGCCCGGFCDFAHL